jgi:hypothetical protein
VQKCPRLYEKVWLAAYADTTRIFSTDNRTWPDAL